MNRIGTIMSQEKNDIYRWERLTKPRVNSRSQRGTTNNDIQDWIQTVEAASDQAAAETFGTKLNGAKRRAHNTAMATIADVHLHDAAYAEAQELLQTWVEDKLDLDTEMETTDEAWNRKTQTEIRKEWDHLLHPDDEAEDDTEPSYSTPGSKSARQKKSTDKDPYSLLDQDEDRLVDDILQGLLDKEVIKENFTRDLGLDDSTTRGQHDPRTKMQLRHLQVKENREKRLRDKEKHLRELQSRKESQLKARQLVQKEEQEKTSRSKYEEQQIQREMAKIRREMDEERQGMEDENLREQKERERLSRQAREEMDRQTEEERRKHLTACQMAEAKRRRIAEKIQQIKTREATDNLKLLQRCFSAWYNVVIENRLRMGKVKATRDWKLLLRTFNAWKSHTRSLHVEQETLHHEMSVKQMHRKQVVADSHCRRRLLQRCLLAWQLFTVQSQNERHQCTEQVQTKNKMAAFLEAAASGKLWSARNDDPHQEQSQGQSSDLANKAGGSTTRKVEELFTQPGRKNATGSVSARSGDSYRSDGRRPHTAKTKQDKPPIQAWQLNRKHVQLTKEELAQLGHGQGDGSMSDKDKDTNRETHKRLTSGKPFTVNNFENRHAAQQKILANQQKQISEQQRLIEELTYLQRQQLLSQQLAQQQMLSQHQHQQPQQSPDGSTVPGATLAQVPAGLQAHIDNLQQNLVPLDQAAVDQLKQLVAKGGETITMATTAAKGTVKAAEIQNGATRRRSEVNPGSEVNQDLATNRSEISVFSTASKTTASETSSAASSSSKHAKFAKAMEERAAERARLKQERDDKRRQVELDRLAQLEAEQQERLREEAEEKRKRVEAYRDKKHSEKLREQQRQHESQRMKDLHDQAERHYGQAVLKFRGWMPWRRLVVMRHEAISIAVDHHRRTLMRKVLMSWHTAVHEDVQEKCALADKMHEYTVVKRCFTNWKRCGEYTAIQEEKADRHYRRHLLSTLLQEWADYAVEEKMASWRKERVAKEHNAIRAVRTMFRAWKRFPEAIRDEEERERRRTEMRKKVSSMLPDFHGSTNESL